MITQRLSFLEKIAQQFRVHPICALLGPRQVGKTTLAKLYCQGKKYQFFDLENPQDLVRLENPLLAFQPLDPEALIVIDEIQRRPDLFPLLRVLADAPEKRSFLILGSASRDLIQQSSETLAGRIGYLELTPFSRTEVSSSPSLWLRGGFPRAFLSGSDSDAFLWLQAYIATFLERDIPNLGISIPPSDIRRFWMMLTHYHGQIFNAQEIGRALQVSGHTVRRYLGILEGTFMVRSLQPWFENIQKRQVKSPKIYFRDSGIFHALLGTESLEILSQNPKIGASWEGWALEEMVREYPLASVYFWSTQSGAELDLLVFDQGKRLGFEFKYSDAPKLTPSMKIACQDLHLDHLFVIYPGAHTFPITPQVTARGLGLYPPVSK